MRPHRRQPMRLPRPWDSPGKNTGVGCHFLLQCMKVKSESELAQSCPALCDPMDCSPPGSCIHGIFQARILEWVAISLSRVSSWPRDWTGSPALQADSLLSEPPWKPHTIINTLVHAFVYIQFSSVQLLSRVRLFATPWIAACQASLSITNSQSSLRLMSIKSVMPSNHLILCRPLLLLPPIPPSIRVFSNESTLRMRWPNVYISCLFSQDKILEIESLEGHSSNTYTELSHMQ